MGRRAARACRPGHATAPAHTYRRRLAVGKNGPVVTVHGRLNDGRRDRVVELRVGGRVPKHRVVRPLHLGPLRPHPRLHFFCHHLVANPPNAGRVGIFLHLIHRPAANRYLDAVPRISLGQDRRRSTPGRRPLASTATTGRPRRIPWSRARHRRSGRRLHKEPGQLKGRARVRPGSGFQGGARAALVPGFLWVSGASQRDSIHSEVGTFDQIQPLRRRTQPYSRGE